MSDTNLLLQLCILIDDAKFCLNAHHRSTSLIGSHHCERLSKNCDYQGESCSHLGKIITKVITSYTGHQLSHSFQTLDCSVWPVDNGSVMTLKCWQVARSTK